jgi:ferredoxin
MTPKVNKELCIGCGACVSICPDVFKMVDGKSSVVEGYDYNSKDMSIKQAKDACPVGAISIE